MLNLLTNIIAIELGTFVNNLLLKAGIADTPVQAQEELKKFYMEVKQPTAVESDLIQQ